MKKITKLSIVSALAAALSMPAFALTGSGAPNGQHYTVNFVGMPKNVKPGNNDGSGGSVIFMPLDTSKITGADPLTCTSGGAQTVFTNDEAPTYYTADPSKGVKIGIREMIMRLEQSKEFYLSEQLTYLPDVSWLWISPARVGRPIIWW